MYSGTTFRVKSGRVMGVHQKIDRVAKRHITPLLPKSIHFPTIHDILHFEGLNGPDGIKRKSPGVDEPWHFIDPTNHQDTQLLILIDSHIKNLTRALKDKNTERAAYEAAWMAHAITDGLTPAHHYPLEEKLEQLRGGESIETRTSVRKKVMMPGKSAKEMLKNNWEFWGIKGVMTTHFGFELGVATTIAGMKLDYDPISQSDIDNLQQKGFEALFFEALDEVVAMGMYDEFSRAGWTRHLAAETRKVLMPRIIKTVALGWYQAVLQASDGHES